MLGMRSLDFGNRRDHCYTGCKYVYLYSWVDVNSFPQIIDDSSSGGLGFVHLQGYHVLGAN